MITFHISKNLNRLNEIEIAQRYPEWKPPTSEALESKRVEFESVWAEHGAKLMERMENLTGFRFESNIDCYVVSGACKIHSHPLMVKSRYSTDEFIAKMCHELTHRLGSYNKVKTTHPEESKIVQNHIFTYSILSLVLTDKQLAFEKNVEIKTYKRAWEIVERDGAEKILSSLEKVGE
jgi:hypothetical protein